MNAVRQMLDWSALTTVLLFLALAYFVGHLLTWVARGGKRYATVPASKHVLDTLRFRPPKQEPSYDSRLEPLWRSAATGLLGDEVEASWSTFYPAAKTYLLQQSVPSIVTIYQNKYTLHRSLAVAAALTAWATAAVMIVGGVGAALDLAATPNWGACTLMLTGSIVAVWGFSSSYLYNWTLWGNYLITETYMHLRGNQ